MAETTADQATVVVVGRSTKSDGYGTYKQKKKEKALLLADKMTCEKFFLEFFSVATTILLLLSLVLVCGMAINESIRISQFKQKILIDRPATTISGTNFMVLSNNEYCNYIIETVLEQGYSAAAAGRVMFMCLYATVPHLLSPHGQQMYLTVDKWGNIKESAANRQSSTKQYNSSKFYAKDIWKLNRTGKYKVGFSENIAFQRRLYEMSGREESDEAIEIFRAESLDFSHIPVVHDLEEALRVDKYAINPMTCPQYFTSWGSPFVDAEQIDQSYLLKYLIGSEQRKCNKGDFNSCEKLHRNYYSSLNEKYKGMSVVKNPFANESIPPFSLIDTAGSTDSTTIQVDKNTFVMPNLQVKEVRDNNAVLQNMKYTYEEFSNDQVRATLLNDIYEINKGAKPRDAMVGFMIVDKNREISMGAGGMRKRSGSKECHQGAFLDSNSDIFGTDTDSASYHHRFIPILRVDRKKKRVITATLMLAEDSNEALQYLFNYMHISITRTGGNALRDFGKDIRSPVIIKQNNKEYIFVKGTPYKEISFLRRRHPEASFREVTWSEIKMDVFGVKMNSTHLKAYYIDKKAKFAALAAQ